MLESNVWIKVHGKCEETPKNFQKRSLRACKKTQKCHKNISQVEI